jgi:hypothetical protein
MECSAPQKHQLEALLSRLLLRALVWLATVTAVAVALEAEILMAPGWWLLKPQTPTRALLSTVEKDTTQHKHTTHDSDSDRR